MAGMIVRFAIQSAFRDEHAPTCEQLTHLAFRDVTRLDPRLDLRMMRGDQRPRLAVTIRARRAHRDDNQPDEHVIELTDAAVTHQAQTHRDLHDLRYRLTVRSDQLRGREPPWDPRRLSIFERG